MPDSFLFTPAARRSIDHFNKIHASRQKTIHCSEVVCGDMHRPFVALTFDDGPHDGKTSRLLSILKRLDVPATFFLVGAQIRKFPGVTGQIAADGHEIGNHTFHHFRLPAIPKENVGEEIDRTTELIANLTGFSTRLFRPPGGETNRDVLREVHARRLANILWSDDPADFKLGRTPARITELVLRDLTPGGIILLHDGVEATMDALPEMVRRIRARGLRFVTVSDLIARGGGLRGQRIPAFISRTAANLYRPSTLRAQEYDHLGPNPAVETNGR